MKREKGFYWVKINNEWTIAEYSPNHYGNGKFFFIGDDDGLAEEMIDEIDEKRIIK